MYNTLNKYFQMRGMRMTSISKKIFENKFVIIDVYVDDINSQES